jgi:hypothetical protein
MNTLELNRRIEHDERGAVLVLGIFMCACMVGVLWYLAGIGDAIIYRERLQEGTDAAAFSAASLHARGMNLIVLLNLLMACILAVRVTLKAVQAGLGLAAFFCAVFPPLIEFEPTCLEGIKLTEDAIRATRQPINNTLKALSRTQNAIKTLVPTAAAAGALQVGLKYKPIVREATAANPAKLTGLPIEEGSIDRLCSEAGESVVGLFAWALPVSLPAMAINKVRTVIGKSVSTAGAYFCEMGSGPATPPDLSSEFDSAAKEGCDQQRDAKQKALDASQRDYESACRRLGAACGGATTSGGKPLSPESDRQISLLKSARDTNQTALDGFDSKKCAEQKRGEAEQKTKTDPNTKLDSGKGMTPKKVASDFRNGSVQAQLIGLGYGNTNSLDLAPKGVKIGQWKHRSEITSPSSAELGFAQAEYFYDCEGRWNNSSCNGPGKDDQLAMWHFRWRARLRRCNAGLSGFSAAASAAELFSKNVDQMPALESVTADNADVVLQLGAAARDGLLH